MQHNHFWYIVMGHCHGDDEASTHLVSAPNCVEAYRAFCEIMTGEVCLEDVAPGVYMDSIWNCGKTKPLNES